MIESHQPFWLSYLPPLLADWDDLLKGVAPIIFMAIYAIAQWLSSRQETPRPTVRNERPSPPGPSARLPESPSPQAPLEETLRREVEQFLQRTRSQQAPPQPREVRAPLAETPSLPTLSAPTQRQAPAELSSVRKTMTPTDRASGSPDSWRMRDETSPPLTPSISTDSIARPVNERGGASTVNIQHAEHLGDAVAHADERMDQHLKDRFEHRLGNLDSLSPAAAVAISSNAAGPEPAVRATMLAAPGQILELLSKPAGIRQAIVLNEILRRPNF